MRATFSVPDPLFVSSPNGGGLLFLHKHLLMPLANEDASGLALTKDGLLWCVQTRESRGVKKVSSGQLRSISVSDKPIDPHDVLETAEGTYIVFTETNQVVQLDASYCIVEAWCFGDAPDSAHVNSLAMHNGRLLASMFGRFDAHRGYKGATRHAGLVVDVRTGQPLIEGLSQPHSLVSVGEELWLCNSEEESVCVFDKDFELRQTLPFPGYTRGLAFGDAHFYVGLSRSRNAATSEVGQFDSAVVAVVNRRSLEIEGYVAIPRNEVYDIRVAPSPFAVTDVMASLWTDERVRHRSRELETTEAQAQVQAGFELARQQAARELDAMHARVQSFHEEAGRKLADVRAAHLSAQEQATRKLADARAAHLSAQELASRKLDEVRAVNLLAQAKAARDFDDAQAMHRLEQDEAAQRIEQLHAESLQTLGDVEKRDALIDELERQFHRITTSRSWRWTWWIRAAMYLVRGHGLVGKADHIVAGQLRQQLRRLRQQIRVLAAPRPVAASEVPLAAFEDGKRDVFIWSVIDWQYRIQRPQHLARELAARGHRVFYISNNFMARADAGFCVEPLGSEGRLFRIQLHLKDSPAIYYAMPGAEAQRQLNESIRLLLSWSRSGSCLSLVQHPFWLQSASILPNHKLVYDCMDHHAGFAGNSPDVLASELELMHAADLMVVTSDWLYAETAKHNPRRLMVRNACEYEHFAVQPEHVFKDKRGRKVIGYYGAIAEWIDLVLLEKVAREFPDCLMLLVGDDTAGARHHLRQLQNVEFTGEVPYTMLPFYLAGFDACMLPFQVIPLTLATNPVKIYEYLSAGKAVVSIALPEIRQFGDLVRTGTDHASFLQAMREALSGRPDPTAVAARQQFAAGQTWTHRVHELMQGVEALLEPKVSVIVVTYNNLALTQECLRSIERCSEGASLEVIVVDNASSDGTPDYLSEWVARRDDRRIILNRDNRGFAAANNQGLVAASGDYLVLLNNDTSVTPGWIATLLRHLSLDKALGMIGPVTNNIGNEARIDIHYDDLEDMVHVAGQYTARHAGQLTTMRTAAFFCVLMRREVYEKVGPLDEAFGIGFFEDDDYCRRVTQAGWTIACADDVFIHHELSASFNKLKHETRQALFEKNKVIYEGKWGAWQPHSYRRT